MNGEMLMRCSCETMIFRKLSDGKRDFRGAPGIFKAVRAYCPCIPIYKAIRFCLFEIPVFNLSTALILLGKHIVPNSGMETLQSCIDPPRQPGVA